MNPKDKSLFDDATRDVTYIGHYGTWDLEIIIRNEEDYNKAKTLIAKPYLQN